MAHYATPVATPCSGRDPQELEGLRQAAVAQLTEALREDEEQRRRRRALWPHTPTGDLDPRAAMTRLATLFPALRDAAGVKP
jgi:hypothetical protein